jgi:hypothetical protein
MAVLLVVVFAIAGVFMVGAIQNWMAGYMTDASRDPERYRNVITRTLAYAVGVNCVLILLLGAYVWREGSKVRRAGVYPLPDARLIRNTKVLRGEAARTRGRVMQVLGAVLGACAFGLAAAAFALVAQNA